MRVASFIIGCIAILFSTVTVVDTNIWDVFCIVVYKVSAVSLIIYPLYLEHKEIMYYLKNKKGDKDEIS